MIYSILPQPMGQELVPYTQPQTPDQSRQTEAPNGSPVLQKYYKGLRRAAQILKTKFTGNDPQRPVNITEYKKGTIRRPWGERYFTTKLTYQYEYDSNDQLTDNVTIEYETPGKDGDGYIDTARITFFWEGDEVTVDLYTTTATRNRNLFPMKSETRYATILPDGHVVRIRESEKDRNRIVLDEESEQAEKQEKAEQLLNDIWPSIQSTVLNYTGVDIDLDNLPAELPTAEKN